MQLYADIMSTIIPIIGIWAAVLASPSPPRWLTWFAVLLTVYFIIVLYGQVRGAMQS